MHTAALSGIGAPLYLFAHRPPEVTSAEANFIDADEHAATSAVMGESGTGVAGVDRPGQGLVGAIVQGRHWDVTEVSDHPCVGAVRAEGNAVDAVAVHEGCIRKWGYTHAGKEFALPASQ